MNEFVNRALQMFGIRQREYQQIFGSADNRALLDLALYSRSFQPDVEGMSHDHLLIMHGRRQMFFRIFHHVKLTPAELETVASKAIVRAATMLQQQQGEAE